VRQRGVLVGVGVGVDVGVGVGVGELHTCFSIAKAYVHAYADANENAVTRR